MLPRDIIDHAISQSDEDYLTAAMKPIYREAIQVKGGRGAPGRRAAFIESAVTKRNGVWIQVHDAIEAAFDNLFERAENAMVEGFGEVFDKLHNNFLLLCDDTETKDEKAKVLEKVLRKDLKENAAEVKAMLEDGGKIAELVAACKAYQDVQTAASKDPSSLFVPQ
jgi:hypothetical protein